MDVIPYTEESVSGAAGKPSTGDAVVDEDGNVIVAGVSGVPTENNWAINDETLAGTKTLVDADPTLQVLNPDGADRDVVLPVLTSLTPFFVIMNPPNATADLLLYTTGLGELVQTIEPGFGVQLWTDGALAFTTLFSLVTETIPIGPAPAAVGRNLYPFGVLVSIGFLAPAPNQGTDVGGSGGVFIGVQFQVAVSEVCTLVDLTVRCLQTGHAWEIWKNNALFSETIVQTSLQEKFALSVPMAVADRFHLQHDSDGSAGGNTGTFVQGAFDITADVSGDPSRARLAWGANLFGTFDYAAASGFGSSPRQAVLSPKAEYTIPEACTAIALAWHCNDNFGAGPDATTRLDVWKNGAFAESIFLSVANVGSSALTTSFAVGDRIAVRWGAGFNPGVCDLGITFSGPIRTWLSYAGNITNADRAYPYCGDISISSTEKPITDFSAKHTVRVAGFVDTIAIRSTSAAGGFVELWKNGALAGTGIIAASSSQVVVLDARVTFVALDTIAVVETSLGLGPSMILALFGET